MNVESGVSTRAARKDLIRLPPKRFFLTGNRAATFPFALSFRTNSHAASGTTINETRAFQKAGEGVSYSIAAKAGTLLGLQPVAQIGFMALLLHRHLSSRESGKTTHSKIMREESRAVTFSGGAKWKKFRPVR